MAMVMVKGWVLPLRVSLTCTGQGFARCSTCVLVSYAIRLAVSAKHHDTRVSCSAHIGKV